MVINMNFLIVDDEKNIVEGIRLLAIESGYSFKNIFLAYDGKEALDILEREEIDIMFSDVKMPILDGFELIEKVRQMNSVPEIVLITGYAEFEYVQKAINSGIAGYILKPIDEKLFWELLRKAVDRVYQKKRIAKAEEDYDDLNNEVTALKTERLLNVVFKGGTLSKEDNQWLNEVVSASANTHYLLISVHMEFEEKFSGASEEVLHEVKQQFRKILKSETNIRLVCFIYGNTSKEFHYLCIAEQEFCRINEALQQFLTEYQSCVPVEIYISLSDTRKKITRELFTHSQEAYYEHYLKPDCHILQYISRDSIQKISLIENELKTIEVHICNGDMIDLKKILKQIFSVTYIKNSELTVRAVYFLVVNTIIMTIRKIDIEIPSSAVDALLSETTLSAIQNVDELSEYIYNFVFELLVEQEDYFPSTDMVIKRIVHYVNVNFSKDLSVKEIGNQFGLTPNYLSQIFKNETGMSFVNYLNSLRIKKACGLLRNSDIKIAEVAKQIGYNDNQYFYRVFKKYMGKTPIEYRLGEE